MRINKFLAAYTDLSRRSADAAIEHDRVLVNGRLPKTGYQIGPGDVVLLDNKLVSTERSTQTILLNKPRGYVCSKNGQGSRTIYELLPAPLQQLNPVGRLDKDSSGLLVMTNDGTLANELAHPRYSKQKVYEITLTKPLQPLHRQMISDHGVMLEDGKSQLQLERLQDGIDTAWRVTMSEGRNRQIRRTFSAVGYSVQKLHRIQFGAYTLTSELEAGKYQFI